jgi:3-hydroxyisobutyrate dehydrogenase
MNITFLGQGAMGVRMADRLKAADHTLTRWNRTGAAQTPCEAVADADIVIAMLRDDEASRAVWCDPDTGALAGMRSDALAIESSTLTVGWVRELAAAAAVQGRAFIDAPVLGSLPQAEAGQLIHLVGGTETDIARAAPVLAAVGQKLLHAGPVGHGAALKLVANTLFAAQVALVAELIGRGRTFGLDPAAMIAALGETRLLSPAAAGAGGLMLAGRDAPMFPVDLVRKDLGYATDAATMPVAAGAMAAFERAEAAGLGGSNISAVHRLYAATD